MMDDIAMGTPSGSSSLEYSVSGREQSAAEDDDGLYYIPERRPSLDLGTMETIQWYCGEQVVSPAVSYMSMASESMSDNMREDDGFYTSVQLDRTDSYSSCYSLDSDDCENKTPKIKIKDDSVSEPSDTPELIQDPSDITHPSLTVAFTFKAICTTLGKMQERDIKRFQSILWKRYLLSFNTPPKGVDMVDMVDRLLERYSLEASLQITKSVLEEIGKKKLVEYLQTLRNRNEVCHDLRGTLKRTYGDVCEGLTMQGEKRRFDDVFSNLHITSTCDNGPNIDHEVMTIEKLDSNREAGKLLSTKDILSPEQLEHSNTKLVLVTGVAGSGKSMAVRRLILDWTEEQSHHHISFLFPLPFRELRQFEGMQVSLLDIIQKLYPETKRLRDEDYRCDECKMMFVFDGLDEYNQELDFDNTELLGDLTEPTSLNVIVVNLLRGRLLYRGLFLVTSRPQAKRCIPWDTHCTEIEVRGFCDPDKDEYFKKRFKEPAQASAVIAHINSLKTLRIMCHLPLFCSLVADECQRSLRDQAPQAEFPRSITYMYTKLLLALTQQHRLFRAPDRSLDEQRDFLVKLGKLAFNMLEQGKFKITESDWNEFGINDDEAVIYSGLCTRYVTKPRVLFHEKVLSFIHPTMQEYLAALYAFLSFRNQGKNIFAHQLRDKFSKILTWHKDMELYKRAVDRSLLCEDGRLDICLRFLFGMALDTNLEQLNPFCDSSLNWPTFTEDAAALLRKRIRNNSERNDNLQRRCLEELGVGPEDTTSSGSDP